jgi:pyrroline-5-carboxylate reductase
LLGGLIKNGYLPENICITDADQEKLSLLKQQFNVQTATNNIEAIQSADVIILAVKPQVLHDVCIQIGKVVDVKKSLILSIAAGIRVSSIEHWIGQSIPIIRAMPNTPALISCGATALYANSSVTAAQHALAESILSAVGIVVWVNSEKQLDAVTALSGSGPAYFFLIIEAMQNAAKQLGLPEDVAKLLTLQTAYGASRMALESGEDITKLRHNVTSPGGTTEQAIRVLEAENIREIFFKALHAANHRAEELAIALENTPEK